MRPTALSWLLALAASAVLAACGGGGGGGAATPSPGASTPAPSAAVLRGVASVGAPLGGALVAVVDAKGTAVGSATAHPTDGSYSLTLSTATPTLPLLLQARGRDAAGQWVMLHTVLTELSASTTAHITPLTQAHAALVLGADPHAAFLKPADSALPTATTALSTAASDFLKTVIKTPLGDLKITATALDLLSNSGFATAKSPADLLLEALRVGLDGNSSPKLQLSSKFLASPAAEVEIDLATARAELLKTTGAVPANAITSTLKVTSGAATVLTNASLIDGVATTVNPMLARAAPADDYKALRTGSTVTDTNAVLYGYERHDGVDSDALAAQFAAWGAAGLQLGPLQVTGCADDVAKTGDCLRVLVAGALTDRNGAVKARLLNAVTYNTTQKRWKLIGNGKYVALALRPSSLLRLDAQGRSETSLPNPSAGVAIEVPDSGLTQTTAQAPSGFAVPLATCLRPLMCLSTPGATSTLSTGGLLDQFLQATTTSWLTGVDAQRGARYTLSYLRGTVSESRRAFLPATVLLPAAARHPSLDGPSTSAPLTVAGLANGLSLKWGPWVAAQPDLRLIELRIVIRYANRADTFFLVIDGQTEVRLPGVSASSGTPTGHEIWLVAEDVRGQQLLTRYTLAP